MAGKPKKGPREKNLTDYLLSAQPDDEDRVDATQRFNKRHKFAQQNKTARTTAAREKIRTDHAAAGTEADALPTGEVLQVFSLYCEVRDDAGRSFLATTRKTLASMTAGGAIVGDRVRFRPSGVTHETGKPEAVVESIELRRTILTRADSFNAALQHPVVANATQLLVVVSAAHPAPRWGLVDRIVVAARAGGLRPVLCLNKIDLVASLAAAAPEDRLDDRDPDDPTDEIQPPSFAAAIAQYASIGVRTLATSVVDNVGLDALRELLAGQVTVLSGHSGVGKSSLIRAIEPTLDIRIGDVSEFTDKGRHTTTSARRYDLPSGTGGAVIDTPGVKRFGLWQVDAETLLEHFPDVAEGTAPSWRVAGYQRIAATLK